MRALPVLVLLAGCAATGPSTSSAEDLARELEGRVAGPAERCVDADPPHNLTPVDSRTLTYRDGSTIWVNRLEADCPGLRAYDRVLVEVHGSQFCRGDHIRSLEPVGGIPGPVCFLSDFVPYRPRR